MLNMFNLARSCFWTPNSALAQPRFLC